MQLGSTASAAYDERFQYKNIGLNWRAHVPTFIQPFLLNSRLRLTTALCPQTVRCFAFSRLWTTSSSSSRKIHAFLLYLYGVFRAPQPSTAQHNVQTFKQLFPSAVLPLNVQRLLILFTILTHACEWFCAFWNKQTVKQTHRQQSIHSFSTHQLQHYTINVRCLALALITMPCVFDTLIHRTISAHVVLNLSVSETRALKGTQYQRARCTLQLHVIHLSLSFVRFSLTHSAKVWAFHSKRFKSSQQQTHGQSF